jgi:flavoprotein
MPAPPNPILGAKFSISISPGDKKSVYLTCRNCTSYSQAKNNTRALKHLRSCLGCLAKQAITDKDETVSQKRQRTLTVTSMPISRKRKLDSMAAMAVFMGARPFRL